MEKEFVPYELALKLKALGFDEPCFCWYSKEHEKCFILAPEYSNVIVKRDCISVPTFSQAFRWFREKYDLRVCIESDGSSNFDYTIKTSNAIFSNMAFEDDIIYRTYEEAELACLERLIDKITNKKIFDFVTDL